MRYIILSITALALLISCNDNTHRGHDTSHKNSAAATDSTKAGDSVTMNGLMETMMNDMHAVQTSYDADKDFAALMKAHHQGAVDMAKLEIAKGRDSAMINMANMILSDQTKEINQFEQFLSSAKPGTQKSDAFYNETMQDMHKMHGETAEGGTIDVQFVRAMIPHHQGAVDMATVYLKYAKDPGLKSLAQRIISSQKKEIQLFQNWLKQQGGA
jgi:uncharacterized protein (DUF305 family)